MFGARPVCADEPTPQVAESGVFLRAERQAHDPFSLGAQQRKHAVAWRSGEGLLPVEVVAVRRPFRLLPFDDGGGQDAAFREQLTDLRPGVRGLVHGLGHDVARPLESFLGGRDAGVGTNVGFGLALRVGRRILNEKQVGQRREALLSRDHRSRPPLRTVRQIEVFECRHGCGGVDRRLEVRRQEIPLGERREDCLLPLGECGELLVAVADRRDGHLVKRSGHLLAVARDERNGRAVLEETNHRADAIDAEAQFRRDLSFSCGHRTLPPACSGTPRSSLAG